MIKQGSENCININICFTSPVGPTVCLISFACEGTYEYGCMHHLGRSVTPSTPDPYYNNDQWSWSNVHPLAPTESNFSPIWRDWSFNSIPGKSPAMTRQPSAILWILCSGITPEERDSFMSPRSMIVMYLWSCLYEKLPESVRWRQWTECYHVNCLLISINHTTIMIIGN